MKKTRNLRKQIIRQTRIVTREEESNMVNCLRNTEHIKAKSYFPDVADLVEVMADTGLRQLEALALIYGDIDFTAKVILVRQTKSGPRRVPMTSRVATILKRRHGVNQLKPFNLNEMQIRIAWDWAKNQIGLSRDKSFVLYSLRRTFATRMMEAKIDTEIVMEILTSRCTASNRSHAPIPNYELNRSAEQLEALLNNKIE